MIQAPFYADEIEPGRCFRLEFDSCDHAWAPAFQIAPSELRRYGQEVFIHQPLRHKAAEQGRAAFVKQQANAEFTPEQFQDGAGGQPRSRRLSSRALPSTEARPRPQ